MRVMSRVVFSHFYPGVELLTKRDTELRLPMQLSIQLTYGSSVGEMSLVREWLLFRFYH